jgi:cyanophycin synthetase
MKRIIGSKNIPYIITVAGTKGKTTIARALNHVYIGTKSPTLLVDTDGHYVNGKQKSTLTDSMNLYFLVPTTCPGRFLYELRDKKNAMAILEASIESFVFGTGYRLHNIGILTNVYEDHIGLRVKNRLQLAKEKAQYALGQIARDGTAIFNADDELITNQLHVIPSHVPITRLPVGLEFSAFNKNAHLNKGGKVVTTQDGWVGVQSTNDFYKVIKVADIPWTWGGQFKPSVYNLMFIVGVLYAQQGHSVIPDAMIDSLKKYRLSTAGGRLTILKNKKLDVKVIADFAHEKYSLKAVAELARSLTTGHGRVLGILRLSPTKADAALQDIGREVVNDFDHIVLYDKIDGEKKKRLLIGRYGIKRGPGDTANLVAAAMREVKENKQDIEVEIEEEKALARVKEILKRGDVVVYIVNDDHKQSIGFAKKYLGAKRNKE